MTQKMMKRLLVVAALLIGASNAFSHEDYRVIGTVTKHQDSRIEVESRNGNTTSIRLDKQTAITRDTEKMDVTELRIGLTVVVDAYGDSADDALALEIRIVPPIANP
jgi:hypothetical protein